MTTTNQATLLPETGFLRLPNIIGNPKANPPIPPIIPVGKSCWWASVRSGRFPRPVKLSRRVTAWRVEDIRAFIDGPEQVEPQLPNSSAPAARPRRKRGSSAAVRSKREG
jgi:hypothetical protein